MIYILKYLAFSLINCFFNILALFTEKQKNIIVFDSFMGKQYSCNPRAVYEYLISQYNIEDVTYVWAFKKPEEFLFLKDNANTVICKYRSFTHFLYCSMADVIIFNSAGTVLPYNKKQVRIQTWHGGGCYKKVGVAIETYTKMHDWYIKWKNNGITHFVSSSEYFTREVIGGQFKFSGEILKTGLPRNDILFEGNNDQNLYEKIRDNLHITRDRFVVLYAPTYRDLEINIPEKLDCRLLKESIRERFGREPIILYRGHRYTDKVTDEDFDLDVSSYEDMQDLLLVSDMLVTDYSSSIWDFSFTGRPCFLYVPDLEYYEKYRGFDRNIFEWGFPVCETNAKLFDEIKNFNGSMKKLV